MIKMICVYPGLFISLFVFQLNAGTLSLKERIRPEWENLKDLNIIPCPKKLSLQNIRFLLAESEDRKAVMVIPDDASTKIRIAVELINESLRERKAPSLEIKREKDLEGSFLEGKNVILLGVRGKSPLLDRILRKTKFNFENYPLGDQGYIIHFLKGKNQVLLTGLDDQGLLYAAVTFAELIQKKGDSVIAKAVNIVDWPDFKYRMGHGVGIGSLESGKRLIDWCLKYKFNLIKVGTMRNFPRRKAWSWLKEVNQYAGDRGIKIQYSTTWAIASIKQYKNDPRLKGCVQLGGNFYCWSRDEFLNEKMEEYKTFIRETGADAMSFHCLDSYEENWPERCDQCRTRFADERADADAHVINLFTEGLRSVKKDIQLTFITQPYGINLNLPGNGKYKDYYRRLTDLIPPDVYLVATGYDHTAASSWYETVRQPVVRWQNGSTFQWGRFFDSSPCFLKGVYFPGREDIAFLNEPIGHFDGDIMQLVGIEYEWNTSAPGALLVEDNPKAPIRERGPYKYRASRVGNKSIDFGSPDGVRTESAEEAELGGTTEPKETCEVLLERVCQRLYGINIAPYMARYLREGLKGWRHPRVAKRMASSGKKTEEECQRANRACQILKEAMKEARTPKEISILKRFFSRSLHPTVFYATYGLALQAEEAAKKGKISVAQELVVKCRAALEDGREKLRKERVYKGPRSEQWLKLAEEKIRIVELKIKISRQKSSGTPEVIESGVRVAIYNPNDNGGLVFPYQTIFNCMSQQKDMVATYIDNLQFETLVKYQVLIMPQVKEFPESDRKIYRDSIRRFVIEKGSGAYFEHDSVGFHRCVLNKSVFPEICQRGWRREEATKVEVAREHPCLRGLKVGTKREHMYWDHIILELGQDGTTILSNLDGDPVVVVGSVGNGRVIFNGMVTFGRDDKEKEDASLIDKILLVNGVRWLGSRK